MEGIRGGCVCGGENSFLVSSSPPGSHFPSLMQICVCRAPGAPLRGIHIQCVLMRVLMRVRVDMRVCVCEWFVHVF